MAEKSFKHQLSAIASTKYHNFYYSIDSDKLRYRGPLFNSACTPNTHILVKNRDTDLFH